MTRARRAAYWLAPPLACLLLHWRGLVCWFRGDDFAWLGLDRNIFNFRDFLAALFRPEAQGTIRPLSERAFFMAGYALFGLNPLPFHMVVFLTQFANLALVAWIGDRLAGRRGPGLWAAVFWTLSVAMLYPLGWTCVFNQPLCGLFLLSALAFFLRYTETGERRYNVAQWAVFLLGFGALELNVVYPALAAAYALFRARAYLRRTLPLFIPSVIFALVHNFVAPVRGEGLYGVHFTWSMLRTLGRYWAWSIGPSYLWSPFHLRAWLLRVGVALVSAGLLAFLAVKVRSRAGAAPFCLAWYLIVIAPVLPLRDHPVGYYVFLPLIGLCWLGGWAFDEGMRAGGARRAAAVALAGAYAFLMVPPTVDSWHSFRGATERLRGLMEGVAAAHELHPGKAILLVGVDTSQFWDAVRDNPFGLVGADQVYLAPGSEKRIEAHPALAAIGDFMLPEQAVERALARDEVVVYDVAGPRLRNITTMYASVPRQAAKPPLRVDAGSPLTAYLLGPEWYPIDGDHRWMPLRATLRMGAPDAPGRTLHLLGNCAEEQLSAGPLTVKVTVDGVELPPAAIRRGENIFDLAFPLPPQEAGRPEMLVAVEVSRTIRPASDPRDLGLAFGVFEVR
jgi:hypothetical protein